MGALDKGPDCFGVLIASKRSNLCGFIQLNCFHSLLICLLLNPGQGYQMDGGITYYAEQGAAAKNSTPESSSSLQNLGTLAHVMTASHCILPSPGFIGWLEEVRECDGMTSHISRCRNISARAGDY
uniref:Uncharacterized protein n=1 Tax=Sphaerodactylus townsendi TaxID=933632 RepID=A0ACB8EN89_9SAUR